MSKSKRLRLNEVRSALRLVGECRDLRHDPRLWRHRACQGLIHLLGVRVVSGMECNWRRPDGEIVPIDFLQAGLTPHEYETSFVPYSERAQPDDDEILFGPLKTAPGQHIIQARKRVVPDAAWYRCRTYEEYHRLVGVDACAASLWELPGNRADLIGLHRDRKEPDFTDRELNLLQLFHAELGELIGPVLVSPDDSYSPTRLPPRVRETLACLLEGDSEKQAAARLGLSVPTVHQYVMALYRHYRVTSRAELLALVLRPPTGAR